MVHHLLVSSVQEGIVSTFMPNGQYLHHHDGIETHICLDDADNVPVVSRMSNADRDTWIGPRGCLPTLPLILRNIELT